MKLTTAIIGLTIALFCLITLSIYLGGHMTCQSTGGTFYVEHGYPKCINYVLIDACEDLATGNIVFDPKTLP